MFARFIRYMVWPDRAYLNKPVAEKNPGSDEVSYCETCRWIIHATSGYSCHHESNKVYAKSKNPWLSPGFDFSLREHPKQKNRNNKCPYYKMKKR